MNIVDSSGWLEFFADGPNADDFSNPLCDTERLIVPSINVFEVFKMADSIILTTAYAYNSTIWTQDSDFKDFQNVKYFPKLKT